MINNVLMFILLDDNGLVNDLNYVEMTIIANTECQSYYGSQFWGSMSCAEGNYNEGICFVS
jgi:hypothetical protein